MSTVTATFYKTKDDPRTIGKSLESVGTSIDCRIYNNSSITKPTIVLKYNSSIFGGANYCKLGAPFNRYYFMSPPQTMDGGRMIIPLDIDVRNTYAQGIRNLTPIVTRSEKNYGMVVDEKVSATSNFTTEYTKPKQGAMFSNVNQWNIVLEVIGT